MYFNFERMNTHGVLWYKRYAFVSFSEATQFSSTEFTFKLNVSQPMIFALISSAHIKKTSAEFSDFRFLKKHTSYKPLVLLMLVPCLWNCAHFWNTSDVVLSMMNWHHFPYQNCLSCPDLSDESLPLRQPLDLLRKMLLSILVHELQIQSLRCAWKLEFL